jgi:surfeit locus 1 family protein
MALGLRQHRPRALLWALLLGLGIVVCVGLGVWQVERLGWKQRLIADVDARIHGAPTPAPGPGDWARVGDETDAYRHVLLSGHYLGGGAAVMAVTERGPGFWAMTPFRDDRGFTVLVDRGFVPTAAMPVPDTAPVRIAGLLRITEPGGGFLRSNDPEHERWYSRDVAAIGAHLGLSDLAPYFVDADAGNGAPGQPIGGLTVVDFPNNHLLYSVTWFGLALVLLGSGIYAIRPRRAALEAGSRQHVAPSR